MAFSLSTMLILGLTFMLAGMVKGMIGLGLPTVAIGLLVLVMTPAQAAALLVIPSLVTNIWQLMAGPSMTAIGKRLWLMMAGIWCGTFLGIGLLTGPNPGPVIGGLGGALIVYGTIGLLGVRPTTAAGVERWLSPLVGAATGIVTGATGVFVIPAVPYLQSLGFAKDELVQALGLSFTVSTLALAAGLWHRDALPLADVGLSVLAVAPALAGMAAGQHIRTRVSPQAFRTCFFAGLVVLGGHLVFQAWG
jgi:uncharacterized membrane protein YfcA